MVSKSPLVWKQAEVSLQLPRDAGAAFSGMFAALDAQLEALEVENYGLSQATLEEIFLKIASNQDEAAAGDAADTAAIGPDSLSSLEEDTRVDNATEGRVIFRHYTAMLTKRVHVGRRDFKSLLCVTLVPVGLLILGLLLLKYVSPSAQPKLQMSPSAQFAEELTPVPYNTSWGAIEWGALHKHLDGIEGLTKEPVYTAGVAVTGREFGVNYTNGIPCDIICPSLDPEPIAGVQPCKAFELFIQQATQYALCLMHLFFRVCPDVSSLILVVCLDHVPGSVSTSTAAPQPRPVKRPSRTPAPTTRPSAFLNVNPRLRTALRLTCARRNAAASVTRVRKTAQASRICRRSSSSQKMRVTRFNVCRSRT